MQVTQLGARLGAELTDQHGPDRPVRGERVGLPAIAVHGEHQLGVQPLPKRMFASEPAQLRDDLRVPAQVQVSVDPRLGRLQPEFGQPGDFPQREHGRVHSVQRLAAPQRQRAGQVRGGVRPGAGAARFPPGRQQRLEAVYVELTRPDVDGVAG